MLTPTERATLLNLLTRNAREGNDDTMAHMVIVDFKRFCQDTGRVYEDNVSREGLNMPTEYDATVAATPNK